MQPGNARQHEGRVEQGGKPARQIGRADVPDCMRIPVVRGQAQVIQGGRNDRAGMFADQKNPGFAAGIHDLGDGAVTGCQNRGWIGFGHV